MEANSYGYSFSFAGVIDLSSSLPKKIKWYGHFIPFVFISFFMVKAIPFEEKWHRYIFFSFIE
jgi:hypothetical protein